MCNESWILSWWCITCPYANGNEPESRVQGPWPRNRSMIRWYSVQFAVLFNICCRAVSVFVWIDSSLKYLLPLLPHLPRKSLLPSSAYPRTEMICRNDSLLCPPIEWMFSLLGWFWFFLSLGWTHQSSISIEPIEPSTSWSWMNERTCPATHQPKNRNHDCYSEENDGDFPPFVPYHGVVCNLYLARATYRRVDPHPKMRSYGTFCSCFPDSFRKRGSARLEDKCYWSSITFAQSIDTHVRGSEQESCRALALQRCSIATSVQDVGRSNVGLSFLLRPEIHFTLSI